jgi:hypothetical protein
MINTAEEFVRLRSSELQEEYWQAAHDEAPLDVWLEIIEKHPDCREWVAHNKTIPTEILEILVKDPDSRVRSAVASKNKLTAELQLTLARDPDESVRQRIVCNKNVTQSALKLLQNDEWETVREHATERLLTGKFKADL